MNEFIQSFIHSSVRFSWLLLYLEILSLIMQFSVTRVGAASCTPEPRSQAGAVDFRLSQPSTFLRRCATRQLPFHEQLASISERGTRARSRGDGFESLRDEENKSRTSPRACRRVAAAAEEISVDAFLQSRLVFSYQEKTTGEVAYMEWAWPAGPP